MRKEFRSLLSLEDALSTVLSHLPVPDEVIVPLESALDRVLGEKIVSKADVPGFDRASMDGYAVRAEDTLGAREDRPLCLRLKGTVPMGVKAYVQVGAGEAVEVSTGSMMPPGANAVVMVENAAVEGEGVLIHRTVHSGENTQAAGSDISLGEAVLFPGIKLTPREVGVLAAVGCKDVLVRRLNVGVASTGNELVPPGGPLGPGQIYDINSYTVASAVEECGACPVRYGILPDERDAMAKALKKMAEECSMILISGSTSAGAGDMVYRVIDEIGEMVFHGVNLKPGKPTLFGIVENKPCLGLPGYPTSALTVFEELAAPAIRRALGLKSQGHRAKGRLAKTVRSEGRHQMLAVGLAGDRVYPVDKGSGSITTLARADGVIDIPADVEYLEPGEIVDVRIFTEPSSPDLVVAGENSILLEQLAEDLPFDVRILNTGSLRGRIAVEDGIADMACVSGSHESSPDMVLVKGFHRNLGLISREWMDLKNLGKERIVGWHRDSEMKRLFESVLNEAGISAPKYVRLARTHSSVAAAVAKNLADLGFGENAAAEQAGLCFLPLVEDEVSFLVRSSKLDHPAVKSFLSSLERAAF
ncbi:MAG TPA: molybdopterin biosynthesis protein [Methanotrichaceae archaeon]|nr:molybdopterin biosynthesis protein [Methanotrichaceae archaeon]